MKKKIQITIGLIIIIVLISIPILKLIHVMRFDFFEGNKKITKGHVHQIDTISNVVQGKLGNRLENLLVVHYRFSYKERFIKGKDLIPLGKKYDKQIKDILLKRSDLKIVFDSTNLSNNKVYLGK